MTKRMTTAKARKEWAKVLRIAQRGTPVEVTKNGQPVAAVVSIEQLRRMENAAKETLSGVIARFRASVSPSDLEGSDPWADVRDRSRGRDVDLG